MIDWLRELVSKHESDNKGVKESEQQQQEQLGRENTHDYIRKNETIHYIDDY